MDYLKESRSRNGTCNSLFYGDPRLPISALRPRPPNQNGGAEIHFGPKGVQILNKNDPIHVLTMALEEESELYVTPPPDTNKDPYLEKLWEELPGVWAEKKIPWSWLGIVPQSWCS